MQSHEKKLYQKNRIGYYFILMFILFNTIYTITALRNMTVDYQIGIFIMINIILSLVGFLASVKVKSYSLGWSILSLLLGAFQLSRIFYLPSGLADQKLFLYVLLVSAAVCAVAGGIISVNRSQKRQWYIRTHKMRDGLSK